MSFNPFNPFPKNNGGDTHTNSNPTRPYGGTHGGNGSAGSWSNNQIIRRNGGVRPQFVNDIGGCSDNYK